MDRAADLALAETAVRLSLGAGPAPSIAPIENGNHLIFRVDQAGARYALKMFVDRRDAFDAEVRARDWGGPDLRAPPIVARGSLSDTVSYLLIAWCAGVPFSQTLIEQPAGDFRTTFQDLGRLTGLRQTLRRPGPAPWPSAAPVLLNYGSAGPDFAAELAAATAPLAAHIGAEAHRRLIAAVATVSGETQPSAPVFSHADHRPKNVMVGETGEVTGLIDWEFARLASPLADLSQMLRFASNDAMEDALGAGCAAISALPSQWKRIARGYDLARIAVGLATADAASPDFDDWVLLARGLIENLEQGEVGRIRQAAARLLDI